MSCIDCLCVCEWQSLHKAELLETTYEQLKGAIEEEMRQKSSHSSQKQLSKSIVDLIEVLMQNSETRIASIRCVLDNQLIKM